MNAQREAIYNWLSQEFKMFESYLDAEAKVELDGKLWKVAAMLADMGLEFPKKEEDFI